VKTTSERIKEEAEKGWRILRTMNKAFSKEGLIDTAKGLETVVKLNEKMSGGVNLERDIYSYLEIWIGSIFSGEEAK